MTHPAGESNDGSLRVDFDRRLLLQFSGSVVTSYAGLLVYWELDDALGLSAMAAEVLGDARAGSGCLNSSPRKISGALPSFICSGLPSVCRDAGRAQPDRNCDKRSAAEKSCSHRDGRWREVSLVRRFSAKARMRTQAVIKIEIPTKRGARLADAVVGAQINLLVLH